MVVVDNLQSGDSNGVDVGHFYKIDLRDKEALDEVFKTHMVEGVIYFNLTQI